MRRIGIVGGLSPESTLEYYREIISQSRERFPPYVYPEVLIFSVNFDRFLHSEWDGREIVLREAISSLIDARAEIIAMASNTPHYLLDRLKEQFDVEFVSIVDAVAEKALEEGYKTLLLVGTKTTMTERFYRENLESRGLEVKIPDEVDEIHSIIFDDLVFRDMRRRERLIEIVNSYDADAIILGCTELPLAIKEGDVKMEIIDSVKEHVRRILDASLSQNSF